MTLHASQSDQILSILSKTETTPSVNIVPYTTLFASNTFFTHFVIFFTVKYLNKQLKKTMEVRNSDVRSVLQKCEWCNNIPPLCRHSSLDWHWRHWSLEDFVHQVAFVRSQRACWSSGHSIHLKGSVTFNVYILSRETT